MRQDKKGAGYGVPYVWNNNTGFRTEVYTDSRVPVVGGKKPKGKWLPPKNYSRTIVNGTNRSPSITAHCVITFSTGRDVHNVTGAIDMSSQFATLPALPLGMKAKCEVACLRKLKAQSVNFSVALGERKQTGRQVLETCKRLAYLVSELKHGNLKPLIRTAGRRVRRKKVRSLDPAFDLWLEYKYGWVPLLSDVHGACKALNEREKEGNRVRVSVKSGATAYDKEVHKNVGFSLVGLNAQLDAYRDTKHKCFVRLDYVKSDSPWAPWSSLGITNPLTVAWELLPWSFVADWFVPVGSYLDILDADLGWSFLGGSASTKTESVVRFNNARYSNVTSQYSEQYAYIMPGRGKRMQFSRTTYSSSPIPSVDFLTTKFTSGSAEHVENGIALLMSAITHKNRA